MDQDKKQNEEVRNLAIIPRGARWVCVGWDWTHDELRPHRREALDGLFRLRLPEPGELSDSLGRTLVLHEQATSWFVPLTSDGVALAIEFGYLSHGSPHNWVCLSRGHWPSARSSLVRDNNSYSAPKYGSFPFNHFESWDEPDRSLVSGVSSHNGGPLEKTGAGTFFSGTQVLTQGGSTADVEKFDNIRVAPSDHPDKLICPDAHGDFGSSVLNFTMGQVIHGRVEDGARVYFNGNKVPVRNGFFNLRVDHPADGFNHEIEVAIVSADGRRREVRKYIIKVSPVQESIESVEIPTSK